MWENWNIFRQIDDLHQEIDRILQGIRPNERGAYRSSFLPGISARSYPMVNIFDDPEAVLAAHDAVLTDRSAPAASDSTDDPTSLLQAAWLDDFDRTFAEARDSEKDESAVDEALAGDWLYDRSL